MSKPKDHWVMTPDEVSDFLARLELTTKEAAHVLGVSKQAVDHWVTGRRHIPLMAQRLLILFTRQPDLMDDFDGIENND